ncbi:MAG: SAM-dependent methyltransferase, partial [Verrucomicrobiae bacterium]|nr:SAM-dependent methyltransferase [Verrucomicrobiae bacterium]
MPATLLRFTLRVLGTSSSALQAELERLFTENGGAIPFERFMQEALYHPEFGYYTHKIRTVGGARGDFATSATLSGLLGMAIARWIQNEVRFLPPGTPIDVIEIGGGEGSLMREVIQALRGPTSPLTRWWRRSPKGFRFHLVEVSPRLRERQRDTLKPWWGVIQWHDQIESALVAARGNALVFSNELVDAFPAVALQKPHSPEADDWSEVCVSFDSRTGIREELRPLRESRPELDRSAFSILPHLASLPPGQRVELHDSYRRWWES